MKKYILFFILFSESFYPQNYFKINDLKSQLARAVTDSARVDLMNAIGFNYFETNSDSARYYSQKALQLARGNNYKRGEARSLMNLGLVFRNLGNLPKSLELLFKSLRICETIGDKLEIASAYTNIAFSYAEHGDYNEANKYQFKALQIDKELKLDEYLLLDYHNLGDGYEKIGILDSALHFQSNAYELAIKNNYDDYLCAILVSLGNIHLKLSHYEIALAFYRKATSYGIRFNNFSDICSSYFGMIDLFIKTNQKDSSIVYADKAYREAKSGNLSLEMYKASTYLAEMYENINKDSTLKYLKMSVALKDSLFNQEKVKQLQNITFAENIRQQELAETKAEEELNERKSLQMFLIAIIVLIFIALVFIFSRLRINVRIIEWLGILTLLLVFTFISMLLHSAIKSNTYMPLFSFLAIVIISLILKPFNHWVSKWMREKIIKKDIIADVKIATMDKRADQ